MKSAAPAVGATAAAAAAATAATAAATAAAPEVGVPPPTPPAESEDETEDGAVEEEEQEEEQPKAEEQGDGAETAVAAEVGDAQADVSADGGGPNQSAAAEQGAIHVFFVCARTCIRVRVADGFLLLFFSFCVDFLFVSFIRLLSMSCLLPLCLSFSYYPPSPPPAPHPPRAHPRIGDDVSRFVSVAYTTTPCLAVRQKPRVALFP